MPTGKNWTVRSFSISLDQLHLLEKLEAIAKREGTTNSQEIVKAIEEYTKRHSNGNPQLLMSHYVKPDEPQPMKVICSYCGGALGEGKIFCRRGGAMWVPAVKCYSCPMNQLRKKRF